MIPIKEPNTMEGIAYGGNGDCIKIRNLIMYLLVRKYQICDTKDKTA
jgi:hypothetical protein